MARRTFVRGLLVALVATAMSAGCGDDGATTTPSTSTAATTTVASSTTVASTSTALPSTTVAPSSTVARSTTRPVTSTSLAPTTTTTIDAACAGTVLTSYRAHLGSEYLGGTSLLPGAIVEGGMTLFSTYPPAAGASHGVGFVVAGACRFLDVGVLVRFEGPLPVWRLLAVEPYAIDQTIQWIGPDCTIDPPFADPSTMALVAMADRRGLPASADVAPAVAAWRVDRGVGITAIDPSGVRCRVEHP